MLATLTTVSSLGYKGGRVVSVLLLLAAFVFIMLSVIRFLQKGEKKAFLITIIALFMSAAAAFNMTVQLKSAQQVAQAIGESECYVEGRVAEVPGYDGTYRYIIRTDDGFEFVLNTNEAMKADVNDLFKGEAVLTSSAPVTVEKAVQGYGERQSISFSKASQKGFAKLIYEARRLASDYIDRYISGQPGAFVKSVLLGNNESLNFYVEQDFAFAGLAHLLVISGGHLSVVVALLMKFLPCGNLRRRLAVMMLVPIIFYMLICGMGPSVVRAGICSGMLLISYTFKRDVNPINSLGISAMLISLVWPQGAVSFGFLLSFFSTLGMLIVCPPIINYIIRTPLPRLIKVVASIFALTLSALLFITALTLLWNGKVSPSVLITNMLLGWLVSLVIVFGTLMLILAALIVTRPFAVIVSFIVRCASAISVAVVAAFTGGDNSAITVSREETMLALALIFAGIILAVGVKRNKKVAVIGSTVAVMGVVFVFLAGCLASNRAVITNVTNDCTVVRYKDKTVVIGNCTSPKEIGRLRQAIYQSGKIAPDVVSVHRDNGQVNEWMADYLQPEHKLMGKIDPKPVCVDEGVVVTVGENYTYIDFDGLTIAVAEEGADLSHIKDVDCTLARGWCAANTKSSILTEGGKVLANDDNRVYNVEEEYFTTIVSRKTGVVN